MLESDDRLQWMRAALDEAYKGIRADEGGPFGACIVRDGEILSIAHNRVLAEHDATAHAEIEAIRRAGERLQTHHLEGAHIFSTTEPCPMCFSAIHWAKIESITFGTSIEDVARLGFNELPLKNRQLRELAGSKVAIEAGFARDECLKLLEEWLTLQRRTY